MESTEYKLYHEEYMKNHNGSTAADSMIVVMPAPFSVFIASVLLSHFSLSGKRKYSPQAILTEFLTIVVPIILCLTVLSDIVHFIAILWGFIAFLLLSMNPSAAVHQLWPYRHQFLDLKINENRRPFITNFRSTVNLITAICILAVDFKIYPRRYAKTENYGYGLMDTGVGLFCLANAIISPEARGQKKVKAHISSIIISMKSSIPLIFLGAARLFTTQQIDYQRHTSEYGVHWNFFITLAVIKIMCTLILSFVNARHSFILSLVLIAIHECILEIGLRDWVIGDTPRVGLLAANREGVVSSLGYVSLYFAGVSLGQLLQLPATTVYKNIILMAKLFALACVLWICTHLSEHAFGISRRLANTGYYFWILAYSVTLIIIFLLVELMIYTYNFLAKVKLLHKNSKHKNTIIHTPIILEAISFNGLFFFLVANVATGVVNITLYTLHVKKLMSLVIINIYMLVICSVTVLLFLKEIKLKVW